jgi:tetratricopeptide (TPR) repeat protein
MRLEPSRPVRPGILLAAALVVVAASYGRAWEGPFVWDDVPLIVEEPGVHTLAPARYFLSAFWRASPAEAANPIYYRPVVTLSYALDWTLGGGNPIPFHVLNVALHLVMCGLVYALARRCGARPATAALGAALFGTMPRLTECVSWVSGRTDVFAAVLGTGALLLHTREGATARTRGAAAGLLLLGLLSKEVAIAAFIAIATYELASSWRSPREVAPRIAPALVSLAIYFGLRWHALRGVPLPESEYPVGFARAAAVIQTVGYYAVMIVDLLRPRLQNGLFGKIEWLMLTTGVAALAGTGALLWHARRTLTPVHWSCIAMASVALGLVLHIVKIPLSVTAADRFLYLPLAALAPLTAAALSHIGPKRTRAFASASAALLLVACGIGTYLRTLDWTDEIRLWKVATHNSPPEESLPWNELGNALTHAGRHEDALAAYQQALARARGRQLISALANVATMYADLERLDAAALEMQRLRRLAAPNPIDHFNLGVVQAKRLRFQEAEQELQLALKLMPEYPLAERMLRIVRECRDEHARLPWPEAPGEPASLHLERAKLFAHLGLQRRASRYWAEVARAPDATAEETLSAARFLVVARSPDAARQAMQRARQLGVPLSALEPLNEALQTAKDREGSTP